MQVDQSKDMLGNFVERFLGLFLSEIKFFVETYSDEIRQRIVRQDIYYTVEDFKQGDSPTKAKQEPDAIQK